MNIHCPIIGQLDIHCTSVEKLYIHCPTIEQFDVYRHTQSYTVGQKISNHGTVVRTMSNNRTIWDTLFNRQTLEQNIAWQYLNCKYFDQFCSILKAQFVWRKAFCPIAALSTFWTPGWWSVTLAGSSYYLIPSPSSPCLLQQLVSPGFFWSLSCQIFDWLPAGLWPVIGCLTACGLWLAPWRPVADRVAENIYWMQS